MTGSYTEVQRRAANQIWGAAGHYDFEPMFLEIFWRKVTYRTFYAVAGR